MGASSRGSPVDAGTGARERGAGGRRRSRPCIATPEALAALPDAEIEYVPGFFAPGEAAECFAALRDHIPWRAERIRLFGREVAVPRLQAWVGEPGAVYTYSGLTLTPLPWPAEVARMRDRVAAARPGTRFDSALLNYYRDGRDSMGWHSDDEPELGPEPVIASISLGATRRFRLRHRRRRELPTVEIDLESGSLLWMSGRTQECWQHQLPKRTGVDCPGGRINLTFRLVRWSD